MNPATPHYKHKTVLLIDDNKIDNFINERIIKNNLFAENVFVHTSVNSALEYFKNFNQTDKTLPVLIPDYIFLDLNMPLMDGWAFLQEFEKLKLPVTCKIIILSASVNPEDISRAMKFKGVKDYFFKPLTTVLLSSL